MRNEQLQWISGIGEQLTTLPMRWIGPAAAAWALAAPPAEYGGLLNHRLPGAPPTVTGPHGNSHLLNTHHYQLRVASRHTDFRRSSLRKSDGEEAPFAGHALDLVSAAIVELEA